jgi:hypothetical protein
MNFSREKNKQKQKTKQKQKVTHSKFLKFNRNIVETEEKSIPQTHIDDHSLAKPDTDT